MHESPSWMSATGFLFFVAGARYAGWNPLLTSPLEVRLVA
jgi:hypothetical protein